LTIHTGASEARVGGGPVDRLAAARNVATTGALAGFVSAALMYLVGFAGRRWSLDVPRSYVSDGTYYLMLAQGLRQNGTYLQNDSLGFPFGQDLRDFPQGLDNLTLGVLRILGLVLEPAAAVNVLFVLGAATIGAVAAVALVSLRCSRWTAVVFGVVFAILPAHIIRNTTHIMLSSYWSLAISATLALHLSGTGSLRWERADTGDDTLWRRRSVLIALAFVVASSGSYYAVFGLLAVAFASLIAGHRFRSWKPLRDAAIWSSGVVAFAALNLLPTLLFWAAGNGRSTAQRTLDDVVKGGLRPLETVDGLLDTILLRTRLVSASSIEIAASYVGLVPILCASMLALILVGAVTGRSRGLLASFLHDRTAVDACLLAGFCLVIAAPYSLSYLISAAGFTWIREWHRISVLIAFFLLVAGARWTDRWIACIEARRIRAVALAAVVSIALVDLMPYVPRAATDGTDPAAWRSDQEFFRGMQRALPTGTGVVTLPMQNFPGFIGYGDTEPYDPAKGYVHAPDLRWEFGALHTQVPAPPANLGGDVACYAHAIGAGAVVVDLRSLPTPTYSTVGDLTASVGRSIDTSADGRYAWFDLRSADLDCVEWSNLVSGLGWNPP
jgi:phosphoglycerol transferase